MLETQNIFKNADGISMVFFVPHILLKNELLKYIIQIYGGSVIEFENEGKEPLIILGDPLKHYLTPNIVSYHFVLDSVNCRKLLDINEYYLNISTQNTMYYQMNEMINEKDFSEKDDEILINIVHRPGIKRYGMDIYNEISKKYGKHSSSAWHDYYRFILEPKLGPVSLHNEKNRIDFDDIDDNVNADFSNNTIFLEYHKKGFTLEEDLILINFIHNSNLPHKGRLVFEKFHNLYPHRSCFSWRNRYVNVLLPLLSYNSYFECDSKNEFPLHNKISDESKKYIYNINKDFSKSRSSKFFLEPKLSIHNKSNNSIYDPFTEGIKEEAFNYINSTSRNTCSSNKDQRWGKTNLHDTSYIHIDNLENISETGRPVFLNEPSIFSDILPNKRKNSLEYSPFLKKQKISKGNYLLFNFKEINLMAESICDTLKNEKTIPDEDDMMMLREITAQGNQSTQSLRDFQEINEVSSIFNNKNNGTIQYRQRSSTPISTDEEKHLPIIMTDCNTSPQNQINQESRISNPSSLSTSSYLDKRVFDTSISSNFILNHNLLTQKHQGISQISKFNNYQDFSSSLSVSNNNIESQLLDHLKLDTHNIDSYNTNLNNNNSLILEESNALLDKTACWYIKNMRKYGITQEDVTFALYRTSGIKKLAIIVMEAISRNLPLPNIEGIWSEEDDLIVYGGSSIELKRVNQKHGGKLHDRIKFLQDYLSLD
ncbi:hypothetical protein PCK1_001406 [Pneumocystis canis]|nr:hypothetical protein PCK1_001406 [Pneumocystis canis]